MRKPNYSFEKRQRELAKKKKKEEKLKDKAGRKAGSPQDDEPADPRAAFGTEPRNTRALMAPARPARDEPSRVDGVDEAGRHGRRRPGDPRGKQSRTERRPSDAA